MWEILGVVLRGFGGGGLLELGLFRHGVILGILWNFLYGFYIVLLHNFIRVLEMINKQKYQPN